MSEGRSQNIASVVIGTILLFFIGAVILGNVEPVMTDMKTSDMSADFNETVDDVSSFGWTSMQLAVLALLIIGGAYILRQVDIL